MAIPIAAASSIPLGLFQTYQGLRGLNSLGEYPEFQEAPEIRNAFNRAEGMAGSGYTGAERSAFMQNLAGQSEQRYKRGVDMAGGGLSGAIQAGINYGNTRGLLNFASDDAGLHRRNIQYADSIARQIQEQRNLITGSKQSRYNKSENAYGAALTKGLENIVNPLNLTQALGWGQEGMKKPTMYGSPVELDNRAPSNTGTFNETQTDWSNPYGADRAVDNFTVPYYNNFGMYGLKPRNTPPYAK